MTTATEVAPTTWKPNSVDRCDRCNGDSRAYSTARKDKLQLFLCGHHTKEYKDQLIAAGWIILDRTDVLDEETRMYKTTTDNS